MVENKNDKTGTYFDSNKDKTETYGNSNDLKTGTYKSKHDETVAYSSLKQNVLSSNEHGLGIGDKLTLCQKDYEIVSIISEGTGEAVIYKIKDQSKKPFVLKLYFEFNNVKEEPNPETLKRIKEINDPDILKLHDFGVGTEKYNGKYCFEISDFAEGGDLFTVSDFNQKYTPNFIETRVIPEIFNGIKKLHDFKIYHCDLKPSNIFFKDHDQTDLVIGDYGSAKAYDLDSLGEFVISTVVKGTDFYRAPEQANLIISEKNDYYSIGKILLHLLYPKNVGLENNIYSIDKKKADQITLRQLEGVQIIDDFNPSYGRLNSLIAGLTLNNPKLRWGKKEIEKWFKGEDVEVQYTKTEIITVQLVKLPYAIIKTDLDFINVMDNQKTWWEDLFEDVDTYQALKGWLGSYKDIATRKIFDEMIHFYKPYGKEFVKEAAIRFFQADRDIIIDMNSYNFFKSANIIKEVEAFISKLDDIWKFTSLSRIRLYIFQLEFSLRQLEMQTKNEQQRTVRSLIVKLYSHYSLVPKQFENYKTEIQSKINVKNEPETLRSLIKLFILFNPERVFKDLENNSILTINDIGLYFIKNEKAFSNKYIEVEKEIFLQKKNKPTWDRMSFETLVFEIFKGDATIHVELLEIVWDRKFTLTIKYNINKSLLKFLKHRDIGDKNPNYRVTSDSQEISVQPFSTCHRLSKCFLERIAEKHNFSISSITEIDLTNFNTEFKKKYNKTVKIHNLIIVFFLTMFAGCGLGYLILSYLDKTYNPLVDFSFFQTPFDVIVVGICFGILCTFLSFFRFFFRCVITIALGIPLITFLGVTISDKFKEIDKIVNYRHEYYINNFNVEETEPKLKIGLQDIYNSIKADIDKFGNEYIPNYSIKIEKQFAKIQANMPVVERTFIDPGFFESWQTRFSEIKYIKDGYYSCANIRLKQISEFKKDYYYPLNINFDALVSDNLNMSRFGLRLNRYAFLIDKNSIEFGELSALPTMEKSDYQKTQWCFVILENNTKLNFTEGCKTKNFRNDRPSGVSYFALPFRSIVKKNLENLPSDKITISISFLKNSISVDINSRRVLCREFVWDLNYTDFKDEIELAFEPMANFSISKISLSSLTEAGRYDKRKDGKDHRFIPLQAKAKNVFNLMKRPNISAPIVSIIKPESVVEILYLENDLYKIRIPATNMIGYCRSSDLTSIDWDKSQILN